MWLSSNYLEHVKSQHHKKTLYFKDIDHLIAMFWVLLSLILWPNVLSRPYHMPYAPDRN